MNRRGFLQMIGMVSAGIAIEQAIPFNRVWSFPSKIVIPGQVSVRLIRAYDFRSSQMINRLDAMYGFGELEVPKAVDCAYSLTGRGTAQQMVQKLTEVYPNVAKLIDPSAISVLPATSKDGTLHGVQWIH